MRKFRYLLSGLVAALAFIGCSDTVTTKTETVPYDICVEQHVDCNDPTGNITCDPVDGRCKCGGEHGNGVSCGEGEVCDLDLTASPPSPSCVSVLCDGVVCGRGEICDVLDGDCKCGGVKCASGAVCSGGTCVDNSRCEGVTCRDGETCDPTNGTCRCGEDICSIGESCRAGDDGEARCVGSQCVGNNCPVDTVCSPVDGLCHCGETSGPTCSAGQSCLVEDAGPGTCEGEDICAGKVCHGGTFCSPLDGECRCGGFTTDAPICGDLQTCDQVLGQCVGGDQCAGVDCGAGRISCDPEEGVCKCGGLGGIVCGAEQGCVAGLDAPICVTRCNPLTPNVEVGVCGGSTMGCYFSPSDRIAFCATAGTVGEGLACDGITDCGSGLHCILGPDGGICRPYCDTEADPGEDGACWGADRDCRPLSGGSAVARNLGVCMTFTP